MVRNGSPYILVFKVLQYLQKHKSFKIIKQFGRTCSHTCGTNSVLHHIQKTWFSPVYTTASFLLCDGELSFSTVIVMWYFNYKSNSNQKRVLPCLLKASTRSDLRLSEIPLQIKLMVSFQWGGDLETALQNNLGQWNTLIDKSFREVVVLQGPPRYTVYTNTQEAVYWTWSLLHAKQAFYLWAAALPLPVFNGKLVMNDSLDLANLLNAGS